MPFERAAEAAITGRWVVGVSWPRSGSRRQLASAACRPDDNIGTLKLPRLRQFVGRPAVLGLGLENGDGTAAGASHLAELGSGLAQAATPGPCAVSWPPFSLDRFIAPSRFTDGDFLAVRARRRATTGRVSWSTAVPLRRRSAARRHERPRREQLFPRRSGPVKAPEGGHGPGRFDERSMLLRRCNTSTCRWSNFSCKCAISSSAFRFTSYSISLRTRSRAT